MSVYNRKGGSGKSGSLRQQFNYYKRQLENRLIQEQAFKEARGIGTIESKVHTMFKHTEFKDVYKQGITRKVGNKTIRFVGDEAIRIQISSMKKRASKSYQADLFINNYVSSLAEVGFEEDEINYVIDLLNSISIDKLTLLIDKNILPSIQFLYAETLSKEELIEQIRNAVKHGVTSEELKEVKEKTKQLVKVIKERSKILGW